MKEIDRERFPVVSQIRDLIAQKFHYFASGFERQYKDFGDHWLDLFEKDMTLFFGEDREKIEKAVYGYGCFALDGMKLQVEFNKTHQYRNKTYQQAASEVYQNKNYMFDLYLPGILISHYLWRHHYLQHLFFENKFSPLVRQHGGDLFYDVGVGTGFYSKEMLRVFPGIKGEGFDLSPFSLEHTQQMVESWNFKDRYHSQIQDIIKSPPTKQAPFVVSIEVLEHLEDPQSFLNALCNMMKKGGIGLISAAINAPNADHIYLYHSAKDVINQIEKSGFKLLDYIEDQAYQPRNPGDLVPVNGAFIVTK